MSSIIKRVCNIIRANRISSPSTPEYLATQRTLFTERYETLQGRKAAQEAIVSFCSNKVAGWRSLIATKEREISRYGQHYVSEQARAAMKQLLEQAEVSLKLASQERDMQQDTLDKIVGQLSQIETVLLRLKSVNYSLEIQKSIRDKSIALNTASSLENTVDAFNMEELNRELRLVEYTTQALIELGAK